MAARFRQSQTSKVVERTKEFTTSYKNFACDPMQLVYKGSYLFTLQTSRRMTRGNRLTLRVQDGASTNVVIWELDLEHSALCFPNMTTTRLRKAPKEVALASH